jgi:cytochrome c-type biogenesis protein CcsB
MFKTHVFVGSVALMLCSTLTANGAAIDPAAVDWQLWRNLPVQNGGRQKPLDTLARETLLLTTNRATVIDSDTDRALNPTALYLTMLFEWSGWDHQRKDELPLSRESASQYSYFHHADRWDKTPLLRVEHTALKQMIGMPEHVKFVTPDILATTPIVDPRTRKSIPFATWGKSLLELHEAGTSLSQLEEAGLELAQRLDAYRSERMGLGLGIVPSGKPDDATWLSVAALLLTKFDDASDPQGNYRRAQSLLWQARTAFRGGDAQAFNVVSAEFCAAVRAIGSASPAYSSQFRTDLEVAYNHWEPFRYAWVLMLLATIGMLLHLGSRWRSLYWGAIGFYGLGSIAIVSGFLMRTIISGRAPVTNMYETVIYVGAGVAALGMIFEAVYRHKYVLTAAAAVSTIALILADNCPAALDPSVRPLEPVLRSNFWLATHVLTITLSFAAFALALGVANITLGYYALRSRNADAIRALSQFTYQAIQVGALLLAVGTVLGGMWADHAWGRFWSWDPKEVWALVALLGYLAVLHARLGGAVGHRGLALLSVLCFSLVVFAWYGVNFVLGSGLHRYGFGEGGQGVVYLAIFMQWLYAGVALYRSWPDEGRVDVTAGEALTFNSRSRAAASAAGNH